MPFDVVSDIPDMIFGLNPGSGSIRNRLNKWQKNTADSSCASVFPMHVRDPYPKGKKPFLAEV
jgi:hypothetical protein